MSYLESVHIAWRTLGVNRTRSVLTVLGIIIGVAAVVCMAAVGAGARSQVTEGIQSLGTNILYVSPGAAQSGGTRLAAGTGHTLTEEDAAAILREVADVEIASPMISRQAQVITGNRNWSTTVTRQRFRLSHRPRMGAGRRAIIQRCRDRERRKGRDHRPGPGRQALRWRGASRGRSAHWHRSVHVDRCTGKERRECRRRQPG